MLKRLRRKFILVIMALITLVFLIVLLAICAETASQERAESRRALSAVLEIARGGRMPASFRIMERGARPKQDTEGMTRAVFTVAADKTGEILRSNKFNVDVSDDILADAVALALASAESEGTIAKYSLRYLRERERNSEILLAFISTEQETAAVRDLVVRLLWIGACGLALLFLASLFLASWALRPVEQAWTRQKRFIADASHELKTPLTVILANLGILKGETWNKWLESTEIEAERMRGLVDELLFLARSDEALAVPEKTDVNLSDAIWKCMLPFEAVAFERGITLESEIASDVRVQGDEKQLQKLVSILLDNACKYAGEKSTVTVTLEKAMTGARLTVQNTGSAIPKDQLAHIFDRFYRADPARQTGGTGLGLAIAQSIARAHGGEIAARSDDESGTTFIVTLS